MHTKVMSIYNEADIIRNNTMYTKQSLVQQLGHYLEHPTSHMRVRGLKKFTADDGSSS